MHGSNHIGMRCRGSVTLRNLNECSVYILDHSTYLSVSNCTNCQIFAGQQRPRAVHGLCALAKHKHDTVGCRV